MVRAGAGTVRVCTIPSTRGERTIGAVIVHAVGRHRTVMNHIPLIRPVVVVSALLAFGALVPAGSAAADSPNGCHGLHEHARFATFSRGVDSTGHETVHALMDRFGCDHHD